MGRLSPALCAANPPNEMLFMLCVFCTIYIQENCNYYELQGFDFFQKDGFYGLAGNTTSGVIVQVKVSNILDPNLIVN